MTTAPDTDTAAPEAGAPSLRRTRQPLDVVQRNFAKLPPHQREALLWLYGHACAFDLTNAKIGALIGYSEATISRLYSAEFTYNGNTDAVCSAIEEAREQIEAEEKSGGRRLPFIECNLSRHVWKLCDLARGYQRMVFMYGDSQIGKSTSLKAKALKEAHNTRYWEMPVGGSLHNFLGNAAEACGMSPQKKVSELRRRIIGITHTETPMLLIIDQMHRCFSDSKGNLLKTLSSAQLATLDFLIEIFDDRNPGIVLAGTPVFREGIADVVNAGFYKQLRRRGLNETGFPLPTMPSKADLNTFARYYGLPPAEGAALSLQTRIIEASGLGVWITRLSMASRNAAKVKKEISWANVIGADDFLTAAAQGKIAVREEVVA
jgi:hypothetical protein